MLLQAYQLLWLRALIMITMQPGSSLVGAGGFNPHQGAAGSCIHPEEVALPWQWPSQSFILLICESWPGFVSKALDSFFT